MIRYTRLAVAISLLCVAGSRSADCAHAAEKIGIRVPAGFEVTRYADDELAHDIYSMTIDSLGRVVVSGQGYVRILIDVDGDGVADSYKQYADGPKSGAQGMEFHGRDLLCTGDAGLIRYRDGDADDRADGPADVFLKIKTGSEHHAHAIQRGPDGWWYMIAGNFAEVTDKYVTLPSSPIRLPNAGTVIRFQPDLAGGEIVADGFRNAYDFAFHPQGDLFVFDSDGERDASLPWYRPTRVFHALPGSNAGWVSRSWKRPNHYADMPPVVAEFGRGSPTGSVCYRHRQFPEAYQGSIIVLDWTFGRVMAVPLARNGSVWKSKPITLMSGIGQFGFAPTDAAVGPDGSLYVCVGGRGTRGSVYRVRYTGNGEIQPAGAVTDAEQSRLVACLNAPQPLSSWSRANWVPVARRLGRQALIDAAKDKKQPVASRLRAVEILTELYGGIKSTTLLDLATAEPPAVRARAIWSAGRGGLIAKRPNLLLPFLYDGDPLVVRFALETLIGNTDAESLEPLYSSVTRLLDAEDRFVRQAAMRVSCQLPARLSDKVAKTARQMGKRAEVAHHIGRMKRTNGFDADALRVAIEALQGKPIEEVAVDAARLAQLALGDVGARDARPAAFDGYASQIDLTKHEDEIEEAGVDLAGIYPTGRDRVDVELSRALSMLAPDDSELLDRLLAKIDEDSHPVDDIHQLLVASQLRGKRTAEQREAIAAALVAMDDKISRRKLNLDSNWGPRVSEMYAALSQHDSKLPLTIVAQPDFGRPAHISYLGELAKEDLSVVLEAFVKNIKGHRDYPWNNDVIYILSASKDPEHRQMIRDRYETFALRSAVLIVLAKSPEEKDRAKFVEGLSSSQLPVLTGCVDALTKLSEKRVPAAQFALLRTLRRLGRNPDEFELREKVVKLLRRSTKQSFGFVAGKAGHKPQPEVVRKWTDYLSNQYPKIAGKELGGGASDLAQLKKLMSDVNWSQGDASRGKELFAKRACVQCHGGQRALGPDLAGVARRFSRDDLFVAIAVPNRDVSPRYQTTLIETTAGKVYTGLIIYESVEGVLLRNATNQTFRIEADEIELQHVRPTSLMPAGLLKDLKPADLADLYQYINGL